MYPSASCRSIDFIAWKLLFAYCLGALVVVAGQVRLDADESRSLVRELDKDGNGELDYREFIRWLRTTKSAPAPRDSSVEPVGRGDADVRSTSGRVLTISDRVAAELREKFDAAIDNGKIKGYEDVFKAMDKDGNGRVSKREFDDGLRSLRVS